MAIRKKMVGRIYFIESPSYEHENKYRACVNLSGCVAYIEEEGGGYYLVSEKETIAIENGTLVSFETPRRARWKNALAYSINELKKRD